ncbi:MAG: succinylglutamate desuccinylase/aspartoacylase family protein [Gammaproteobacteria bacterium]
MAEHDVWINDTRIAPGERLTVDLPVAKLYTHTQMAMPVHVVNGRRKGPRLFVSAAIHGDEIIGVEVIRRLLRLPALKRLRGSLFAIPIVNVHGLIHRSRYLPDRRDLNRSFPGSERGSLAARLADLVMTEIVEQCTHGIDIHTAAQHRSNLPQIRANLDDPDTERLARAFGVPVLLNSDLRDGSLREAAAERGMPMLLYEAGEALRFDEVSVRAGVDGIVNVMRTLEMLPASRRKRRGEPMISRASTWVRAPESGILRTMVALGGYVERGWRLGVISDPFGEREAEVTSPVSGLVIGRTNLPLVNQGEGLFHIARFPADSDAAASVEAFQEEHQPEEGDNGEPDIEGPIL